MWIYCSSPYLQNIIFRFYSRIERLHSARRKKKKIYQQERATIICFSVFSTITQNVVSFAKTPQNLNRPTRPTFRKVPTTHSDRQPSESHRRLIAKLHNRARVASGLRKSAQHPRRQQWNRDRVERAHRDNRPKRDRHTNTQYTERVIERTVSKTRESEKPERQVVGTSSAALWLWPSTDGHYNRRRWGRRLRGKASRVDGGVSGVAVGPALASRASLSPSNTGRGRAGHAQKPCWWTDNKDVARGCRVHWWDVHRKDGFSIRLIDFV